ncbi:MAG: tRNA (adenosine(37)-N6)-dimethylallyltransferase MiaA [Candidatus Babeliales bacterium]|jgi:tRNA dimethylallyltransferase
MASSVIIIIGPTASGKTFLAEHAAIHYNGHIINADMGQFYTPLTIGTAKPAWRDKPFKCHLFDVIDTPETIDVKRYRHMVQTTVNDCLAQHTLPIIVGGSLFYVQSLFFPPHDIECNGEELPIDFETDTETLWNMLNAIDSERAQALHPNDRYRIVRALKIWQTTHQKPSTLKPCYNAPFTTPTHIIALEPSREELCERIQQRTTNMIYQEGWLEETETLLDTPWELFVQQRGFIGYTEIISWIRAGKNRDSLPELIALISQKTQQYAKRQVTFWHKLEKLLVPHRDTTLNIDTLPTTGETSLAILDDLCQKLNIFK